MSGVIESHLDAMWPLAILAAIAVAWFVWELVK